MVAKERPLPIDGRDPSRGQSANERRHREAMARNAPPPTPTRPGPRKAPPRADAPSVQWADWDQEAGHRARRLLSRSDSGLHRVGDRVSSWQRWLARERWVKRLV